MFFGDLLRIGNIYFRNSCAEAGLCTVPHCIDDIFVPVIPSLKASLIFMFRLNIATPPVHVRATLAASPQAD